MDCVHETMLQLPPSNYIGFPSRPVIQYKSCLLVHLSLNGKAPSYISSQFSHCLPDRADPQSSDRRQTWTYFCRDQDSNSASEPSAVQPPKPGTLPLNVRPTSNTQTFKCRLKTFLFCKSYSNIAYLYIHPHSWQTDILLDFTCRIYILTFVF